MHKSQADRIRSLGFAPKPKNLVRNYEPSNQEMSWFKGRVKTLLCLHSEKMSQIHNLGSARRVQLIGNIIPNIEGKHVGTVIVAGLIGNTILASQLEKSRLVAKYNKRHYIYRNPSCTCRQRRGYSKRNPRGKHNDNGCRCGINWNWVNLFSQSF